MTDALRSNGRKAKAVFACAASGFWREFDLPARLPKTNLILNRRFHLKPLAAIFDGMQHACVALVDRSKARVFEITDDMIVEKLDFINELTRRGRSDGWGGYDAGHVERAVRLFQNRPRDKWFCPAEPIWMRYHDAGHLLGDGQCRQWFGFGFALKRRKVLGERRLDIGEPHTVLWPCRASQARLDGPEVEFQHLRIVRRWRLRGVE